MLYTCPQPKVSANKNYRCTGAPVSIGHFLENPQKPINFLGICIGKQQQISIQEKYKRKFLNIQILQLEIKRNVDCRVLFETYLESN